MSTEPMASEGPGAEPPSMDAYEIWLSSQRRARTYGRAATVIGVIGGLAVAYVLMPATYGHAFKLALAVLWGLVSGRLVEHLTIGFGVAAARPATGVLALAGLGLGALSTAGLLAYFDGYLKFLARDELFYVRDRSDEWALMTVIAAAAGTGAFFLITKGPDQDTFDVSLAANEHGAAAAGGHGPGVVRARLILGAVAVAMLIAIPFVSASALDWRGLQPVGAGLVVAAATWWLVLPQVVGRARRAAAAAEVKEELDAIRRANARVWLGRLAALGSAAAVIVVGMYGLEWMADRANRGARYPDRYQLDMKDGFWLLVAGILVGLFVQNRFERQTEIKLASDVPPGGVFDDSIRHTGSVEVRQKLTLMSVLFGSLGRDQYEMIDGGHAFCAYAGDRSGFFSRLFLGGRRPINLAVDDLGNEALQLSRGFMWLPFLNRARVREGQRELGRIAQRFSIYRRYTVTGPDGAERYDLCSGLIFRSRFEVKQGGVRVGELRRVRKPWYIRMFQPFWKKQDRFSLVFPPGSGLDDRKLLVGSLFLVDITHYPTQSTIRWGALALLVLTLLPGPADEHKDRSQRMRTYDSPYDRPVYDLRDE